jgi:LysM repeat protein
MSGFTPIEFESFKDQDCTESLNGKWISENGEYSKDVTKANHYNSTKAIGATADTTYSGQKADTAVITLQIYEQTTFDLESGELKKVLSSGTFPELKSTEDQINDLKDVVMKYSGAEHRPPVIKIVAGDFIFKGVCTEFKQAINKNNKEGKLMMAEVKLEFKATVSPSLARQKEGRESPDMTHYYTVKEGETLPIISNNIYGTTNLYLPLARFNKLHSPRALKVGQKIIIPPLTK